MKLRFPSLIVFSCLVVLLPVVSITSYSQEAVISESAVHATLNAIDRAARKGNVPGIIAPLARDIKIRMTVSAQGSTKEHVLNLNKDQYAFHTRNAMRRRLAYYLERKNTRVKIYDDLQTAMVTSDVYETLTIRQGTLRAVSSEVAILNLRNGKIVITSIEARTRFY
jgi:hypothetical protein